MLFLCPVILLCFRSCFRTPSVWCPVILLCFRSCFSTPAVWCPVNLLCFRSCFRTPAVWCPVILLCFRSCFRTPAVWCPVILLCQGKWAGGWEEGEGRKGGHNLKPVPLRQNGRAEREGTGPEFLSELAVLHPVSRVLLYPLGHRHQSLSRPVRLSV